MTKHDHPQMLVCPLNLLVRVLAAHFAFHLRKNREKAASGSACCFLPSLGWRFGVLAVVGGVFEYSGAEISRGSRVAEVSS